MRCVRSAGSVTNRSVGQFWIFGRCQSVTLSILVSKESVMSFGNTDLKKTNWVLGS